MSPALRSASANRDCLSRQNVARSAKPGADNRSHLGDTIVAELRAARLPLEPRQFEFWFAYKSGRNARAQCGGQRDQVDATAR